MNVPPKDEGVQTYTLTSLPRNQFGLPSPEDNNDLDLNHSNISSWVVNNMPRSPRLRLNRRPSTSSSETGWKKGVPSKSKHKGFKLPMTYSQQRAQPYQAHLHPPSYHHLHMPHPPTRSPPKRHSSPKTCNKPVSRIPQRTSPKSNTRQMYSQVGSKTPAMERKKREHFINNMNNARGPIGEESGSEKTCLLNSG